MAGTLTGDLPTYINIQRQQLLLERQPNGVGFPPTATMLNSSGPRGFQRHTQHRFIRDQPSTYRASLFFGDEHTPSVERRKKDAYRKELDQQLAESAIRSARAKPRWSTMSEGYTISPTLSRPAGIINASFPSSLSHREQYLPLNNTLAGELPTVTDRNPWWSDILNATGSRTDRPVERKEWSPTRSDTRLRGPGNLRWNLEDPWDATLGKVIDERTYFGRGGNGIFGQPLTSEEKHARLSYRDELRKQIEENKRRKREEKERLIKEDMILEEKIAEYHRMQENGTTRKPFKVDDLTPTEPYRSESQTEKTGLKETTPIKISFPSTQSTTRTATEVQSPTWNHLTNVMDSNKPTSPMELLTSRSSYIALPESEEPASLPFRRFWLSSDHSETQKSGNTSRYSAAMGSVVSLDPQSVQQRNNERLLKLKVAQANNNSLTDTDNPEKVLSKFLENYG